ncbi:MAG TPA: glycerol-3-phosphate dehydrogenase/oxidase [Acidobacteriota bacterium]|nr:glycerol-3-phosphate dehydrogenase/oxidase [Acidobacteriota bacterium]
MADRQDADLLVIGGGITGAGIAQDAASRGLKTVLVEKGDFACGTSSKSSKLVHGGLRYLEHFRLGLMRESVSERHTLTRLAPGLVHWAPFLLPHFAVKGSQWKYSVGLWLYDHLARTSNDLRHRSLDGAGTLERCPGLRTDGLQGAALFYDCITDDARLVLSVMLDARSRGASIHNYVMVEEIIRERGKAAGARVRDVLNGESWEIRASQIVSATGPWTDKTFAQMKESRKDQRIRPAKGVHVVLRRDRMNLNHTILIPSAHDGRFLFVIPWYEGIVVGTTDTDYHGDPDEARPERPDVDYILDALNWSFPDARITLNDIVSSYAGIRPLINVPGKSTSDVPREYRVFQSDSGVLLVAGGKLTTYRLMARMVVDRVVARLRARDGKLNVLPCWTHRIKIGDPPDGPFNPFGKSELAEDVRNHLVADYGNWSKQIAAILEIHPHWGRRMVEGLPYILAEAHFAVTREKARTLEDVFSRRTRVALLDPDRGQHCLRDVSEIMAKELNWDVTETQRQVRNYEAAVRTNMRGPGDFR